METSKFADAIRKEWGKFFNGSRVDLGIVQPYIFDSWQRCRSFGLDPHRFARKCVSPGELQSKLEAQHDLLNATALVVQMLFEGNTINGLLANLYDTEGVLLYTHCKDGDDSLLSVQHGAIVKEEISGTNAVSMCIQQKKTIETCGAEHYYSKFHNYICSAVPIWQGGEFRGILNFTLPVAHFHAHFRNLMKMTTFAISERLLMMQVREGQQAMLDVLDEGLILFDLQGHIRNMNAKARQLCGWLSAEPPEHLSDIIASQDMVQEMLKPGTEFMARHIPIRGQSGTEPRAISLEKTEAGGVLVLRETPRSKAICLRAAGSRPKFRFEDLKGASQPHRQMLELAKIAAQSDITTLIMGESGTGMELVAQAIHNGSSRAKGPFIPVNCGALPPDLVQSELFGYEEGAFTGAAKSGKPGKFELADKGTIFLDEIGEMPLQAQVSLLRLIQNGEVMRIGTKAARQVNVRIIAATNKNLFAAIQKNEFREDLFYRLNIFSITMPPLRARAEDIELLATYFLDRFARSRQRQKLEFTKEVLNILKTYAWPGNVRELENTVARMAFLANGAMIDVDLVPENIAQGREGTVPKGSSGTLSANERECILGAIRENRGNLRAAAKALGISRSGLYVKMQRLGITPAESRTYER